MNYQENLAFIEGALASEMNMPPAPFLNKKFWDANISVLHDCGIEEFTSILHCYNLGWQTNNSQKQIN